jgi:phospholipase/lecithinase/hemolysin
MPRKRQRPEESTLKSKPQRFSVSAFLLTCILTCNATAAPYSKLIVFGDSLSDVGNIASSSFDIYPGKYYYEDRFSNGAVWVETFATSLGLPATKRSTSNGDNFAYGGARTTGTGGIEGIAIRDVNEQVTQYLGARTVDPAALYVVFAGSNDFISGQTNVSLPTNSLANDLTRLITAGARNFLVPNLPLLGYTPRFNVNATTAATYNARTKQFNDAMDSTLVDLSDDATGLNFFRLDVAALFVDAIANPTKFGLANVTDAAAPGLEPGDSSYNTSLIAANASQYLFWDDLHPTATVHSILAARALALVDGVPGDFDADAAINGADLALWQTNYGAAENATRAMGDANNDQAIDGADFLIWQRYATIAALATPVPEPQSWLLLVGWVLATHLFCQPPKKSSI